MFFYQGINTTGNVVLISRTHEVIADNDSMAYLKVKQLIAAMVDFKGSDGRVFDHFEIYNYKDILVN